MKRLVFSLFVFLLASIEVKASGFDSLVFRPAPSKGSGIYLWSPKVLNQYDMHFATNFTFEKAPFKLLTQGQPTDIILDHLLIEHFQYSLGLIERWLEVGFDFPLIWVVEYKNPNLLGATHDSRTRSGDTKIYLKSEIMPMNPSRPFSFGLLANVGLPTGSAEEFLGNDSLTFDFQGLFQMAPVESLQLYSNLGVLLRNKFEFRDFSQTHQILYGLGATYLVSDEVAFSLEALGRTRLMSPFNLKSESPFEVSGTLRFTNPRQTWGIDFGGSAGIIRGAGVPDYKVFFGLHLQNTGEEI